MKKFLLVAGIILVPVLAFAQTGNQDSKAEKQQNYKLEGFRHGVSFFPAVEYKSVQYVAGDSLKFHQYHSEEVVLAWMKRWAEKYPDLVDLYEVGKSYEGRPIMQMTFTNKKTGKDTDKPAAFFEGGRHSGEVTGTESVLYLAKYLLENYGRDPDVTHLLDTKAIYLKPINNPDGHNLYMKTAQSNRSTVRPDDNDGDGLLDEDAPEDLDGDGMILMMRWKDEKKGSWIPDPKDSTGRIMKRVAEGKGIYVTASEGIDNDNDGKINEDGIGGLDLHRNYPENWRPETEMTGRGYSQGGAGKFPLSETETRAVVLFLLTHPNVYVINSMDTAVPMHLRPPSTSASEDRMYPEDLEWYKTFDRIGKEITGYDKAGDVYNDYGSGSPLFGHGPDFGYWYYGAIWYGDEIWNGARGKDYNNDGKKDQLDMLIWDREENNGEGFHDWHKVKHPVYGEVETGGFDPKFFSQNPPASHLEKWAGNEAMFNLTLMKYLPQLEWGDIEVKKTRSYKADSADFQVRISYSNTGRLPTALKQAELVKIVKEDRITLDFDTAGLSKQKKLYRIIEQKPKKAEGRGRYDDEDVPAIPKTYSVNAGFTAGGATTTKTINLRIYGISELKGKASVASTRGGILKEREFVIR